MPATTADMPPTAQTLQMAVVGRFGASNGVWVQTYDAAGHPADCGFHLVSPRDHLRRALGAEGPPAGIAQPVVSRKSRQDPSWAMSITAPRSTPEE